MFQNYVIEDCFNVYVLEIKKQFLSCYNNLATAAKQTLKGTSFNIQSFGCWLERFSVPKLKIETQFFSCYNNLKILF